MVAFHTKNENLSTIFCCSVGGINDGNKWAWDFVEWVNQYAAISGINNIVVKSAAYRASFSLPKSQSVYIRKYTLLRTDIDKSVCGESASKCVHVFPIAYSIKIKLTFQVNDQLRLARFDCSDMKCSALKHDDKHWNDMKKNICLIGCWICGKKRSS